MELGCAEAGRKDFRAAMDALKKAIELDPSIRETILKEPDLGEFIKTPEGGELFWEKNRGK